MKTFALAPILAGIFLFPFSHPANAQLDTTGGRFLDKVFDTISVVQDVVYANGLYANGMVGDLKMDIYQPQGDTMAMRPVILLAHGGGFVQGNKVEMEYACRQFSRRGYVTVSIQYRLGYSSLTTTALVEMVIRATQDMKNAVRFLRKSVSTGNPYKIHPDLIFCGGYSAGAITALHVAYMDDLSEIPVGQSITSLDSLHNSAQIPGFDWKPKAVINIAGAVGDTNWMASGDLPVISFHGTSDATVPYTSGNFGLPFGPSVSLFGSFSVFKRAQNLGIRSGLRSFTGAGHDYTITFPWASDTTETRVAQFLLPYLLEGAPTAMAQVAKNQQPRLQLGAGFWWAEGNEIFNRLECYDLQGRLLAAHALEAATTTRIPTRNFVQVLVWKGSRGEVLSRILPAR